MKVSIRILVLLITVAALAEAKAQSGGGFRGRSLEVGAGVLSHAFNRLSRSEAGEAALFGAFFYELKFQANFPVWSGTTLSPVVLYMPDFLLPTKQPGGHAKTTYAALGLPFFTAIADSWDVQYGLMLLRYSLKGEGGVVEMGNGTSTSTFAVPGRTERSQTIALVVGPSYTYGAARFSLDVLVEGLTNSGKRTYSVMLSGTWLAYEF